MEVIWYKERLLDCFITCNMQATINPQVISIFEQMFSHMSPFSLSIKFFSMAFLLQNVLAYPPSVPVFERQTTALPDYVTKFGREQTDSTRLHI